MRVRSNTGAAVGHEHGLGFWERENGGWLDWEHPPRTARKAGSCGGRFPPTGRVWGFQQQRALGALTHGIIPQQLLVAICLHWYVSASNAFDDVIQPPLHPTSEATPFPCLRRKIKFHPPRRTLSYTFPECALFRIPPAALQPPHSTPPCEKHTATLAGGAEPPARRSSPPGRIILSIRTEGHAATLSRQGNEQPRRDLCRARGSYLADVIAVPPHPGAPLTAAAGSTPTTPSPGRSPRARSPSPAASARPSPPPPSRPARPRRRKSPRCP
jgi:hypothetical protein